MSLTSIIDGRGGKGKELKQLLEQTRPKQEDFKTLSGRVLDEYEVHAPYGLTSRGHAGIAGTAFDYLARALVARELQENKSDFFYLSTAVKGVDRLGQFPFNARVADYSEIQEHFEQSLRLLDAFIRDVEPPALRDVAATCCSLARFEHLARSGFQAQLRILEWTLECLSNELAEIVDDLENLAAVFRDSFIGADLIRPDSEVFFNPCFPSSPLLGGADADIVVDGTLYDFKTTKDATFRPKDASQLWGYYLLSVDDGMWVPPFMFSAYEGTMVLGPNTQLKRIALYKARFGEIEYVDLASVDADLKYEAQERFDEYLRNADWM